MSTFGSIREIRMKFMEVNNQWEAWVAFSCHEEALQAKINIDTLTACGKVVGGDLFIDLLSGLNSLHPIRRLVVMVKDPLPHHCGLLQGLRMRNLISSSSAGTSRRKWEAYLVGTFQGLVRRQSLSTPNLKLNPVCLLS